MQFFSFLTPTQVYPVVRLDEQWVAKNRTGGKARILEAQITADNENPETCMVRTLMHFQARKTAFQCAAENPFFWSFYEPAKTDPAKHQKWYKKQVMGKHMIGQLLTRALTRAGIDCSSEGYTAGSARKVLLDGGLDNGVPEVLVGKLAGQRSHHAKDSYIHKKDTTHRAANIAVSRAGAGLDADYGKILKDLKQGDRDKLNIIESKKRAKVDSSSSSDEEYQTCVSQSRIMSVEALKYTHRR